MELVQSLAFCFNTTQPNPAITLVFTEQENTNLPEGWFCEATQYTMCCKLYN